GNDVRAFGDVGALRIGAIEMRNMLARQRKQRRPVMLDSEFPGFGGFVRVRGTNHGQPGNRSQSSQMLDRFVRRTILTDRNAIVREYIEALQMAQRTEANGGLHVVGEHKECRAERKHSTVSGHAVYGSAHRMFANTEGDVAAGVAPLAANSAQRSGPRKLGWLKIPHSLQSSIGRWI